MMQVIQRVIHALNAERTVADFAGLAVCVCVCVWVGGWVGGACNKWSFIISSAVPSDINSRQHT